MSFFGKNVRPLANGHTSPMPRLDVAETRSFSTYFLACLPPNERSYFVSTVGAVKPYAVCVPYGLYSGGDPSAGTQREVLDLIRSTSADDQGPCSVLSRSSISRDSHRHHALVLVLWPTGGRPESVICADPSDRLNRRLTHYRYPLFVAIRCSAEAAPAAYRPLKRGAKGKP